MLILNSICKFYLSKLNIVGEPVVVVVVESTPAVTSDIVDTATVVVVVVSVFVVVVSVFVVVDSVFVVVDSVFVVVVSAVVVDGDDDDDCEAT